MNKETYERTELEVIGFPDGDVIVTSPLDPNSVLDLYEGEMPLYH